jgi:hypothetical protein
VRELEGEVAAGLSGLPAAEGTALGEDAEEGGEPVVPVVVAGEGEEGGRLVRADGHGGAVDAFGAVLVAAGGGGGVDLVAAHDQELAALGCLVEVERRRGEQGGDGEGGVEPVPEVGDVVEPQLVVMGVVVDSGGETALKLPLVRIGPEDLGDERLRTGGDEDSGGKPANGFLRLKAKLRLGHVLGSRSCHPSRVEQHREDVYAGVASGPRLPAYGRGPTIRVGQGAAVHIAERTVRWCGCPSTSVLDGPELSVLISTLDSGGRRLSGSTGRRPPESAGRRLPGSAGQVPRGQRRPRVTPE